ncbi:hypothetical protein SDC9_153319 [bioreactor metagenome]|uniref:Uncharacterized protein n=1 Tax=bioreactor metagenome TaxID=1076179 RepID=A0A645F099_9ZZZZ
MENRLYTVVDLTDNIVAILTKHGLEEPDTIRSIKAVEVSTVVHVALFHCSLGNLVKLCPCSGRILFQVQAGLVGNVLVVIKHLTGDTIRNCSNSPFKHAILKHSLEDIVHIEVRILDQVLHGIVTTTTGIQLSRGHNGCIGSITGKQGCTYLGCGISIGARIGQLKFNVGSSSIKGLCKCQELFTGCTADSIPNLQFHHFWSDNRLFRTLGKDQGQAQSEHQYKHCSLFHHITSLLFLMLSIR